MTAAHPCSRQLDPGDLNHFAMQVESMRATNCRSRRPRKSTPTPTSPDGSDDFGSYSQTGTQTPFSVHDALQHRRFGDHDECPVVFVGSGHDEHAFD